MTTSDTGQDIRLLAPHELEAVLVLEQEAHRHPWSAEMFRRENELPFSRTDLLWIGDELAGFICSWLLEEELHILNVVTASAFRRRGVASSLLRHVIVRAMAARVRRAFLEVRAGNEAAISLYHSFGFRPIGQRRRYYADGEDAVVMELELAPDAGDAEPAN